MQARQRGQRLYEKPALPHDGLVDRMLERGLVVSDRARVERYLRHVGYYRLSPYMIPWQVSDGSHHFERGVTFDDVLSLYVFDRKLRLIVLDAVERVEVAVRAATTDVMALRAGPHWYADGAHFIDSGWHAELLRELQEAVARQLTRPPETERSRLAYPSALEHYVTNYGEPVLPPSWIMIESRTIGELSRLYTKLARKDDRTAIASRLGINEPLLRSWLRTYVRVRNICAHHGRLWNVGLGVYPLIPTSTKVAWPQAQGAIAYSDRLRLYPVLASLQSVLRTISPRSSWSQRLGALLNEYAAVPRRALGIPSEWTLDPFWHRAR